MSLRRRKITIAKNKDEDQLCSYCTQGPVSTFFNLNNDDTGACVTAQLISAFVFATRII